MIRFSRPIICMLLLLLCTSAGAQLFHAWPYRLRFKKDFPTLALTGGLALGAKMYQQQVEGLSAARIQQLNAGSISAFDRPATQNWNPSAARLSDWGLYASFASLSSMLFIGKTRNHLPGLVIMATEAFLINYSATTFAKSIALRPRPYMYNPNVPLSTRQSPEGRFSFFSGHASTATCMSFFTASVLSDCFPKSPLRFLAWAGAIGVSGATGWLRIRAGKHFPSDVITGWAFGAATGILVPFFHRRKKENIRLLPSPGSITVSMVF